MPTQGPSVMKSVRIPLEDNQFIEEHGLIFSKIVKNAIKELKKQRGANATSTRSTIDS